MKPFEEGKFIGDALAELQEDGNDPMTEEELRATADLLAYYFAEDEEQQRTLSAGIIWGATRE